MNGNYKIIDADWRPTERTTLQRDYDALAYSYRVEISRKKAVRRMDKVVDRLFGWSLSLFCVALALLFLVGY